MMTNQLTAPDQAERFGETISAFMSSLDDQLLVSQYRCVDSLLDLYNTAPSGMIRDLVTDALDDIRHVSSVKAEWMLAKLETMAAAISVESAFFSH